MTILETKRLILKKLTPADAPFILVLLNDPAFICHIGDKGVRDLEGAQSYITLRAGKSYETNGFGMYLTIEKESGQSIGLCGLVKRAEFDFPDVGYAFLPKSTGKGYATESAAAVLKYGNDVLNIPHIIGITSPDNAASVKVLEKIGLHYEKMIIFPDDQKENMLFVQKK